MVEAEPDSIEYAIVSDVIYKRIRGESLLNQYIYIPDNFVLVDLENKRKGDKELTK